MPRIRVILAYGQKALRISNLREIDALLKGIAKEVERLSNDVNWINTELAASDSDSFTISVLPPTKPVKGSVTVSAPDKKVLKEKWLVVHTLEERYTDILSIKTKLSIDFPASRDVDIMISRATAIGDDISKTLAAAYHVIEELGRKHIPDGIDALLKQIETSLLKNTSGYSTLSRKTLIVADTDISFYTYFSLENLKTDSTSYREYQVVLVATSHNTTESKGFSISVSTLPDYVPPGSFVPGPVVGYVGNNLTPKLVSDCLAAIGDEMVSDRIETDIGRVPIEFNIPEKIDSIKQLSKYISDVAVDNGYIFIALAGSINKVEVAQDLADTILPLIKEKVAFLKAVKPKYNIVKNKTTGTLGIKVYFVYVTGPSKSTVDMFKLNELKVALDLTDDQLSSVRKILVKGIGSLP